MRWAGFRKVRGQVRKRLGRRLAALGIEGTAEYRRYLEAHPDEWQTLGALCAISISRFYRDKGVYEFLASAVVPAVATAALARRCRTVRFWSAGCASGEEPYTLALLWRLAAAQRFPTLDCRIVATDSNSHLIARARQARYRAGSLKDLPPDWRDAAFREDGGLFALDEECRAPVELRCEDLRQTMPDEVFDVVLCRNLAFTYFDDTVQRAVLQGLVRRMRIGGALVIGQHERLPESVADLEPWSEARRVYRRRPDL